jgi:hypothetical protein
MRLQNVVTVSPGEGFGHLAAAGIAQADEENAGASALEMLE